MIYVIFWLSVAMLISVGWLIFETVRDTIIARREWDEGEEEP